jgi:hypothetical protein
VNRPARRPSAEAGLPGDVGDDDAPPQAESNVASVAPDAAWQAPAQKWRREIGVLVSDITEVL